MIHNTDNHKPITVRDLYPDMTDEELVEAEDNLKCYVAVIVRIYERLKAEGKEWPTPEETARTMEMEKDGLTARLDR